MRPHGSDKELRWAPAALWAGLGTAAYGISLVLGSVPGLAEGWASSALGAGPARVLSAVTSTVPFSLGEGVLVSYVLWMTWVGVRTLGQLRAGHRSRRNAFARGARRLVRDGGVVATLFYVLWGFNYSRPGVPERLEWPRWKGASIEELVELTSSAVAAANEAYVRIHGSLDAGTPTPFPEDVAELEAAIGEGFYAALEQWSPHLDPLRPRFATPPSGRAKRPLSSGLVARFGMAGVFFPFTAEPHVIRGLPAVSSVQTLAHELAHLWGFANEAEASFVGYLAGISSTNPYSRYAASVFAARQLLAELSRVDREQSRSLRAGLAPGVQRDLADVAQFWEPYRGVGQRLGSAVNDRYLRANRVSGGVGSYERSVRLMIELARQLDLDRGTEPLFPPSSPQASR